MHHIDRSTPWDEIWQAMEQLVREGKVTYVGSSNFAGWHVATVSRKRTSGTSWAWCPSRACTTSTPAPSNSSCFPPCATTASA
ncbi:aldo/keto reductase [Streptomyces massasporeus]